MRPLLRGFTAALTLSLGIAAPAAHAQPIVSPSATPAAPASPSAPPSPTPAPDLGALFRAYRLPPPPLSRDELLQPVSGSAATRARTSLTLAYSFPALTHDVGLVRYDFAAKRVRYVDVTPSAATVVRSRGEDEQCVTPVTAAFAYAGLAFVLTERTPVAGCIFAFDARLRPVAVLSGFPVAYAGGRYVLIRASDDDRDDATPELALAVFDAATGSRTPVYPVAGDAHVAGYDLDRDADTSATGAARAPVFAIAVDPNGAHQVLARRAAIDYVFALVAGRWRVRAIESDRLRAAFGVATIADVVRLPFSRIAAKVDAE